MPARSELEMFPGGPWDFPAIVKYPDNETAFRVLARIGLLEVVKTETFPAGEGGRLLQGSRLS